MINTTHIQEISQISIGEIKGRLHPIICLFFSAYTVGRERTDEHVFLVHRYFSYFYHHNDNVSRYQFLYQAHNSKGCHLHRIQCKKCPPEVCSMALSIEHFLYARHQNNLCAVSHFIVTNCVTGISMSVLQTRKPVGIESLKVFSTVTQLVSCRRRI